MGAHSMQLCLGNPAHSQLRGFGAHRLRPAPPLQIRLGRQSRARLAVRCDIHIYHRVYLTTGRGVYIYTLPSVRHAIHINVSCIGDREEGRGGCVQTLAVAARARGLLTLTILRAMGPSLSGGQRTGVKGACCMCRTR